LSRERGVLSPNATFEEVAADACLQGA